MTNLSLQFFQVKQYCWTQHVEMCFGLNRKKIEPMNNATNCMLANKFFTTCVFRGTLQMKTKESENKE